MSFPKYPRYKDSGFAGLGNIPQHWEVKPLKHLITQIGQGWSPQCEGEPAAEGAWGVLKVGCCNEEQFDPSEQKGLPDDVEPEEQYEVQAGDILMSRGNTLELVGMAAVIENCRGDFFFPICYTGSEHSVDWRTPSSSSDSFVPVLADGKSNETLRERAVP